MTASEPAPAPSLDAVADYLAALRVEHRTVPELPPELHPRDEATAYAVQERLVRRLLAHHGGATIGYKIACTSTVAQRLLGTDGPVYGRLLSATTRPSPASLAADAFHVRVVEPEFAFVMAEDVPRRDAPWTRECIAAHVGDLLPAIEVVSHRFRDFEAFDGPVLACDNASHGAWVEGPRTGAWRDVDLAAWPVRLEVNGETVSTGDGSRVLGHPLAALAWLANALAERGLTLRRGERVTTGLATDVHRADAGDVVVADFGALGRAELRFG